MTTKTLKFSLNYWAYFILAIMAIATSFFTSYPAVLEIKN